MSSKGYYIIRKIHFQYVSFVATLFSLKFPYLPILYYIKAQISWDTSRCVTKITLNTKEHYVRKASISKFQKCIVWNFSRCQFFYKTWNLFFFDKDWMHCMYLPLKKIKSFFIVQCYLAEDLVIRQSLKTKSPVQLCHFHSA